MVAIVRVLLAIRVRFNNIGTIRFIPSCNMRDINRIWTVVVLARALYVAGIIHVFDVDEG